MSLNNYDNIVALATPPGTGALGIVRLSGPEAISICDEIFSGKDLRKQESHTMHFGAILSGDAFLDEVVVGLFKGPKSYTGEDIVEITCHGSSYIAQKIIELLVQKGARLAKPGEFTLRAFLNGKMDLSQAEGVADLIASNSEAAHKAAIDQLRGGIASKIRELRAQLIHFASLIELELDFSEEDVEFADRSQLVALIEEIMKVVHQLAESFRLGNAMKNGVPTVIAGRPNAGKSTLLNTLLEEERAIVSEIPGTTRDTIEEVLNINGIHFRLMDTAGIREATDIIESKGIERTLEKIRKGSVVIYLYDPHDKDVSVDDIMKDLEIILSSEGILILVENKSDLGVETGLTISLKKSGFSEVLSISAKDKIGIDALKQRLFTTIAGDERFGDGTTITTLRHYESLNKTEDSLKDVLNGINAKISGELLAQDIRYALTSLGEITGEVTTDDLLENIFSKFCIGK